MSRTKSQPAFANRLALSLSLLLVAPVLAIPACGGSGDNGGSGNQGGSGNSGSGVGGDAGGIGLPGAGGSGNGGNSGSGGEACVSANKTAELRPLDIYVMLDQSGSMIGYHDTSKYDNCTEAVQDGGIIPISRWKDVTAALNGFMKDPSSVGINVGLGFFPPYQAQLPGQTKCQDNMCDIDEYVSPEVPIASLPGNATPIASALDFTPCPCNGTPMSAGLQGAVKYAQQRAAANPDHVVVVVLATDGEPKGDCSGGSDDGENYPAPTEVAKDAFTSSPSIPVYVIGVGNLLSSLNAIAEAGGTGKAFLMDGDQGTQDAFIKALNEIRGKALSCEIPIPPPPPGETLDPNKVNVVYKPSNGSPEVTFTKAADPSICDQVPGSWYYDDPAKPTQIILCPDACATITGDNAAQLDVGFGCESVIAIPK
ncbi:vWA domain-containing protein [Polyangium aurulentum]|uniref:vWA domain-containing protein n=1 Tax=Polyangium aurulentum TaxID=2567896 RepID=UPI0010AE9B29|nr:vWA domain-containing protein [Polyangium aurulentum]UQA60606.1 VWA domain-containing protein [Polyangium aurulentum]